MQILQIDWHPFQFLNRIDEPQQAYSYKALAHDGRQAIVGKVSVWVIGKYFAECFTSLENYANKA